MLEAALAPVVIAVIVLGVGFYCRHFGSTADAETASLIMMTWAASIFVFYVTGSEVIESYAAIDAAAAGVLYLTHKKRWQYIVIYMFAAMVFVHALAYYGIVFTGADIWYLRVINGLLVAQMLVVGTISLQRARYARGLDRRTYWGAAGAWLLADSNFGGNGQKETGQ